MPHGWVSRVAARLTRHSIWRFGLGAVLAVPAARAQPATSADEPCPAEPCLEAASEPVSAPAGELGQPVRVVITGTRTRESWQRSTLRTQVVTRAEANRRGARTALEALSAEPTVDVQRGSSGLVGGIRLNGMDGERVLVLEDGEPLAGRSSGAIDLGEISLAGLERIEVVAGPMSALYGSDAIGGVVNLITAPPRTQGASLLTRSELRTRGAAFNELGASYRRGDSWATLEGSLAGQAAVVEGSGPALLVPATRSAHLGLRAGARLIPRVGLVVKARFDRDLRESILANEVVVGGEPLLVLDAPTLTSDRLALRAVQTLELGRRSRLELSLGRTWYTAETRTHRPRRANDDVQHDRERVQHLEATLTHGERQRTWVFGVSTRSEKLTARAASTNASVNPPVLERYDALPPTLRTNAAVLGQLGWQLSPSFSVLPGFRLEAHNQHGLVPAPRLAAAYHAGEHWTFRSGAGRGFRSPSPKELGYQLDHCWLGYSVAGDPDLEPERSWGVNADATYRDADRVVIKAGAFGNWVNELIETVLVPEGLCATGDNYRTVNVARARTAGADLGLEARPLRWLRGSLHYAYLWTRDESTGQPLNNRPPHTWVAALTADRLPLGATATLRFRRTSAAFVEDGERDLRNQGYDALSARVAFRPLAPLELYVGGENLLNVSRQRESDAIRARGLVDSQRPLLGTIVYAGVSGELPGTSDPP